MNNLNQEDLNFIGPNADAVVQLAKRFRSKKDLYEYMRDIVVSQPFWNSLMTSPRIFIGRPPAKSPINASVLHAADPEQPEEIN